MFSPLEEIKSRLDIVEVISNYLKLQKAGRNFKALCPFHGEKTPSFVVSPERQIWHCFGCSEGGDIFGFVMKMEGLEFKEALKILAQRAGVILKKQDPKLKTEKQKSYEICELSCEFFEKQLWHSKTGKIIQKYLKSRGLEEKTIKQWRLGYAPDASQSLLKFLLSRGYKNEEIEKTGLVSSFKFYDLFRNRIMFPIYDLQDQIIGFSGRIFTQKGGKEMVGAAKYINTPNTLIYDKSRTVYGFNFAKMEIKKKNFCVVVEGNMDALMSHQAGVKNVAASSGTALTAEQLKIIKRYTQNLYLSFDPDSAGQEASQRAIESALLLGFNVKVLSLKNNDPADLIAKNPKLWEEAIENAKNLGDFYFDFALAKWDKNKIEEKKSLSAFLLSKIKILPSKIEQSHWLNKLSLELKIPEKILLEEMKQVQKAAYNLRGSSGGIDNSGPALQEKKNKETILEERLLAILAANPQFLENTKMENKELFNNNELKELFAQLKKGVKISDEGLNKKINYFLLYFETQMPEIADLQKEIDFCLKELAREKTKKELDALSWRIKEAEGAKDAKKLQSLLSEFNQKIKQCP